MSGSGHGEGIVQGRSDHSHAGGAGRGLVDRSRDHGREACIPTEGDGRGAGQGENLDTGDLCEGGVVEGSIGNRHQSVDSRPSRNGIGGKLCSSCHPEEILTHVSGKGNRTGISGFLRESAIAGSCHHVVDSRGQGVDIKNHGGGSGQGKNLGSPHAGEICIRELCRGGDSQRVASASARDGGGGQLSGVGNVEGRTVCSGNKRVCTGACNKEIIRSGGDEKIVAGTTRERVAGATRREGVSREDGIDLADACVSRGAES